MQADDQLTSDQAQESKAITSTLSSFHKFYNWEYGRVIRPKSVRLSSLSPEEALYLPWYPKFVEDLKQYAQYNREFTQELALHVARDWEGGPATAYRVGKTKRSEVRSGSFDASSICP